MKSWLAKTLLWSAIALVVFAGLWMLLDAKWSGELERLHARPSVSVEELLPPIDPAEDAGPIYVEAGRVWASGQHVEHGSPEFARIQELMRAAAQKPHCRLWKQEQRTFAPESLSALATLSQNLLLPALRHADAQEAWQGLDSLLALSVHLREDPLIVSLLISSALARHSFDELRPLLVQFPLGAEEARRLLASVQRLHTESDILRALDGERVLVAEPAWDSITRGHMPGGPGVPEGLLLSTKLRLLRPWRALDEAKYLELQAEYRSSLVANPWEARPAADIPAIFPFTKLMAIGPEKIFGTWVLEERHARDLAEIALRLAIARAESGSYPSTLDALGDTPREPLTNEPYSYARAGPGYTLSNWSIPR